MKKGKKKGFEHLVDETIKKYTPKKKKGM